METKQKNKEATESMGNTTEEGQEDGGRWRKMRDKNMTMIVMTTKMMIMMMMRKMSNKQEKEKNSKGPIREIGRCTVKFTL
jgi:hypothetical protein